MDKGFCEAIKCKATNCDECLARKYDEYVEEIVYKAMKSLANVSKKGEHDE